MKPVIHKGYKLGDYTGHMLTMASKPWKNNILPKILPTLGYLEYKLTQEQMDYVWRCIKNRKKSLFSNKKKTLAGNVSESYDLDDKSEWFERNVLFPLQDVYADVYGNQGHTAPVTQQHPYHLNSWWVNFQKQHEFNPNHHHGGVYSFVIFMKIPYDWRDQHKKNHFARTSNNNAISNFEFCYTNVVGQICQEPVYMSPDMEGTMLFFPSSLCHQVYPFYGCDEDRVTVSGNINLNTSKKGLLTMTDL